MTNQKEFTAEKVIKKKRDEFYVKLKSCDKSFNSQINKKDIQYKCAKFSQTENFRETSETWIRFVQICNKIGLKKQCMNRFAKRVDSATLKSSFDQSDIDELEKVPNDLSSLKSKVDKLHIGKLETTPFI